MNIALILLVLFSTDSVFADPAICETLVDDYEMNKYMIWNTTFASYVFYLLSYKLSKTQESLSFIPFDVKIKYPLIIQCDQRNDSWIEYTTSDNLKRIKTIEKWYDLYNSDRIRAIRIKSNKPFDNSTIFLSGCLTILKRIQHKNTMILKRVYPVTMSLIEFDGDYENINYKEMIAEFDNVRKQNFRIDYVQEEPKFCENIQIFLKNCTQYHNRNIHKFTWFPKILLVIGIFLVLTVLGLKFVFSFEKNVPESALENVEDASHIAKFPKRKAWEDSADSVSGSHRF
jgi:hypothetical protein